MRYFYFFMLLIFHATLAQSQDIKLVEKAQQYIIDTIKTQPEFQILDELDTFSFAKNKLLMLDSLQNGDILFPELRQQFEVLDDTSFVEIISSLPVSGFLPSEYQQYMQQFNTLLNDSTSNIKKKVLEKSRSAGEQELVNQVPEVRSGVEAINKISAEKDSLNVAEELGKFAEDQAMQLKELEHLPAGESTLNDNHKNLFENDEFKNVNLEKPVPENPIHQLEMEKKLQHLALDHFQGHQDQVQSAVDKVKKYKEKHFLEESKGSTGNQKMSFKRRTYFGGTFQLARSSPLELDLSPLLGYRITKNWSIGAGGTLRTTFNKKDDYMPSNDGTYGYRLFLERQIKSSWLIHGEFESIANRSSPTDGYKKEWNSSLLAGIGKDATISKKLRMQILLLYNFSNNFHKVYQSPFNFRIGLLR